MIGIDVVDLKDPLLQSRDSTSLRFILHAEDQIDLIKNHPVGFWIVWAAKESVFKAHRKHIRFDPLQIQVQLLSKDPEGFYFESGSLMGKISIFTESVLACCCTVERFIFKVAESNSKDPSQEVRALLIQDYLNQAGEAISIGSEDKMPVLLPSKTPVSFSHHRRFLAYAYPCI